MCVAIPTAQNIVQIYEKIRHPHIYPLRFQGNRIKLWPRQGFHEGNLVKSLHGIDVS